MSAEGWKLRNAHWVEAMKRASVIQLAEQLGLEPRRENAGSPGSFACLLCHAVKRHTKTEDKRGAVYILPNDQGWKCFQCGEKGDQLDLMSCAVSGQKVETLSAEQRRVLWKKCEEYVGCVPVDIRPRLEAVRGGKEPEYPEDALEFLRQLVPVTNVVGVSEWLAANHIHPATAKGRRLAFALPAGAQVPSWAYAWKKNGNRLIVPLYDHMGTLRSFKARAIRPAAPRLKSLAAAKHSERGLVFACERARALLSGSEPSPGRVLVVEGEKKYLQECMDNPGCAVIGLTNQGSFTAALAERFPAGTSFFLMLDPDQGGADHANSFLRGTGQRVANGELKVKLGPGLIWSEENGVPKVKLEAKK